MSDNVKMKRGKKIAIIIISVILALIFIAAAAGVVLLHVYTSPSEQKGVAADETIVRTDGGLLQGRVNDGVYNFLGVEYAKADKLFQPAQKTEPWEGIKTAFEYGPSSMQSNILGDFGAWVSGVQYDNDCQNLNIWTPGLDGEKRAVMVWLHGGGFSTGSAYSMREYNGEALAKSQNVVVVSVNHRLNALRAFRFIRLRRAV